MPLPSIPWLPFQCRWVACIDLLGFSRTVCESGWETVVSIYEQSLEQLVDWPGKSCAVECAWFSDTFILYTQDDSASCFTQIEVRTRFFVNGLIMRRIPFTGALSCGDFIALKDNSIFIGPALVDAYRLCEDQDWVGFALSRTAAQRMRDVGLPPDEMLNYRYWQIPRKQGDSHSSELPALLLGGASRDLDRNLCYTNLREMRELVCAKIRPKYDHAIRFLEKVGTIRTET